MNILQSKKVNENFIIFVTSVNLNKRFVDAKKTLKKFKNVKQHSVVFSSGSINLIAVAKKIQKTRFEIFHVKLEPLEGELEVCMQYRINFANVPKIIWTLGVEVSQLVNLDLEPDEIPEIAFHFPAHSSCFRTAMMSKSEATKDTSYGFIINEQLKKSKLSLDANQLTGKYCYENILSSFGFDNLGEIIIQNGKLLIELKTEKQRFLAFINLQVFNFDGVKEAYFLEPIYYRNKKIIEKIFHQNLDAFPIEENSAKKKDKRKPKEKDEEIEGDLVPILNGGENAAIVVKLTISHPQIPEKHLEDLMNTLNRSFHFINNVTIKNQLITQSERDFAQTVSFIASRMEKFIDENSALDLSDVKSKIQEAIEKGELFNKDRLKEAVIDVIGNKLNVGLETGTNNEFKVIIEKNMT